MSNARIFVIVHNQTGEPVAASVEYKSTDERRYRKLSYDQGLQRHVGTLEPGACHLRIQGPKGTSEEQRHIEVAAGDNHVSVMVAPSGMPALVGPQGNWYFTSRDDERLLHVQGREALERATDVLKKHKFDAKPMPTQGEVRPNDVLFSVKLSGGEDEAQRLAQLASSELAEQGLSARVAVPGYVGDDVSFGLTDEIVIKFKPEATPEEIARLAKRHGLEQLRAIAWMGNGFLFRRDGGPSLDMLDLVADLNKDPIVDFAEPNVAQRLQNFAYTPGDYLYAETPHLPLVNADDAWETIETSTTVNRGGSPDIVVAVLDLDGVDPTHADLTGALSDGTAKQFANFDFVTMTNQTLANCGGDHGTQCAGSATGRFDNTGGNCGVAPNCKLIGGGFSPFSTQLQIADIWVWMAGFPTSSTLPGFPAQLTQGADIISNSWGPGFPNATTQTLRDAFDFLTTYPRDGRGVIMVFATGNYGYTLLDTFNPYAFDQKTLAIGASINASPTNPVNSLQADHQGNSNNLPAVVDNRSYISPYGMTVDIVSPSHTCYGPGLPGAGVVDPIMAPARTGLGDWPGNAVTTTTLNAAASAGDTVLSVASTAGFAVGDVVLLAAPGTANAETTAVTAVAAGQLTVTAIVNAHGAGTSVATGPADYAMNAAIGFGGTSHSCPTVAGAAALMLSVQPDLNWIEVRDILRATAVQIDIGQAFATGQWIDLDGDTVVDFSQWYGYGRLDVDAAVTATIGLTNRTDAVVRDNLGDNGAVPSAGWHASSPDIWTRKTDDPIPALAYGAAPPHENPQFGQDNYVFMRVRNNGTAAASTIFLRALITHFPGIEFQYPDDWQPTPQFGGAPSLPLQPGTYLIGEATVSNLAPGADTIVKMTWDEDLVPPQTVTVGGSTVNWHPCLLAEAAPHDGPAIVTGLAYPVKGDNNIAHRNISIDYPAMGGSSGLMSAVVAGTRDVSGVDMVVIDRTALPADVGALVSVLDKAVLKHWVDLVRKGDGIHTVDPLGVDRPKPGSKPETGPDPDDIDFGKHGSCDIMLLSRARLAVRCCDDDVLVIDAPRGTKLRKLCAVTGRGNAADALDVVQVDGRPAIRIDHGVGAIALPYRLARGEWQPVLVGTTSPNTSDRPRGRILVSQIRGDGEVSAGYQFDV